MLGRGLCPPGGAYSLLYKWGRSTVYSSLMPVKKMCTFFAELAKILCRICKQNVHFFAEDVVVSVLLSAQV